MKLFELKTCTTLANWSLEDTTHFCKKFSVLTSLTYHRVEISGFFVMHILREINLGESRGSKTAVIAISEAQISKIAKAHKNQNSKPL